MKLERADDCDLSDIKIPEIENPLPFKNVKKALERYFRSARDKQLSGARDKGLKAFLSPDSAVILKSKI